MLIIKMHLGSHAYILHIMLHFSALSSVRSNVLTLCILSFWFVSVETLAQVPHYNVKYDITYNRFVDEYVSGNLLSTSVSLNKSQSSPNGFIEFVDVFVDNKKIDRLHDSPYNVKYPRAKMKEGKHTIRFEIHSNFDGYKFNHEFSFQFFVGARFNFNWPCKAKETIEKNKDESIIWLPGIKESNVNVQIESVAYFIDDEPIDRQTNIPQRIEIPLNTLAKGKHTIKLQYISDIEDISVQRSEMTFYVIIK